MRLLNIKKSMHCLRSIKIIGVVHRPSQCGQVIYAFILEDLSINNITKYNKDPFCMNKTNIQTLKHMMRKHFLEYH